MCWLERNKIHVIKYPYEIYINDGMRVKKEIRIILTLESTGTPVRAVPTHSATLGTLRELPAGGGCGIQKLWPLRHPGNWPPPGSGGPKDCKRVEPRRDPGMVQCGPAI